MPAAVAAPWQSHPDHPLVRLETAASGPGHAVSLQETPSETFTACATVILECQLACVRAIDEIRSNGVVALDRTGLILREYADHCNYSGRPGVGDVFFKYTFDNQYTDSRMNLN